MCLASIIPRNIRTFRERQRGGCVPNYGEVCGAGRVEVCGGEGGLVALLAYKDVSIKEIFWHL